MRFREISHTLYSLPLFFQIFLMVGFSLNQELIMRVGQEIQLPVQVNVCLELKIADKYVSLCERSAMRRVTLESCDFSC